MKVDKYCCILPCLNFFFSTYNNFSILGCLVKTMVPLFGNKKEQIKFETTNIYGDVYQIRVENKNITQSYITVQLIVKLEGKP